MGLVQLYSDKTDMKLVAMEQIAYFVYVVLLKLSLRWSSWLMNNGHSVGGFLPVGNVKVESALLVMMFLKFTRSPRVPNLKCKLSFC